MPQLEWDKVDERRFEAGLDRGVLYLANGRGVPWNGLTSVDENISETTTPFYMDGVKYLDVPSIDDYSAVLKALTFPDEFLEYDGVISLGEGLYVGDQPVKQFGLSYRTLVGDGAVGTSRGYQIHILWNLTAQIDARNNVTMTDIANLTEFSWNITGVPEWLSGYRPTAHAIIDTTQMDRFLVADLEEMLYGDAENDSRLPSLEEFGAFLADWTLFEVTDNGDGTWMIEGPDELIDTNVDGWFQIREIGATYVNADRYNINVTEP